jgi:RNA polymerase-binding transcription factor DksA
MDTQHFKQKLEAERKLLEKELNDLGFKNTEGEWEVVAEEMDVAPPQQEANEAGDRVEDYEEREGESKQLQARWMEVKHALEKIDNGKYGLCEVDNEPISEDRLEANPAARTCEAHM